MESNSIQNKGKKFDQPELVLTISNNIIGAYSFVQSYFMLQQYNKIVKAYNPDLIDQDTDKVINILIGWMEGFGQFIDEDFKLKRVGKGCIWIEVFKGGPTEDVQKYFKHLIVSASEELKDEALENFLKNLQFKEQEKIGGTCYVYEFKENQEFQVNGEKFSIVSRNGGPFSFNPQYKIENIKTKDRRTMLQSVMRKYLNPGEKELVYSDVHSETEEILDIEEIEELIKILNIK